MLRNKSLITFAEGHNVDLTQYGITQEELNFLKNNK